MNVQCGFFWEKGLAYIARFTNEEYDTLPDVAIPKVILDSDGKTVIIDFGFIKLPFNVFVLEEIKDDIEIVFLCYREPEFYSTKFIVCKITKDLLIEASGMQKALEMINQ